MDKVIEQQSSALEVRFDEYLTEQQVKQQVYILCMLIDLQ